MKHENNEAVTPEITVSANKTNTKPKKQNFFKSRSFKYGTTSTILTAIVIVVVIAANMLFSVLTESYSWSIDVTSNKMYEIPNEIKQVINSLDPEDKIKITVFYDEKEYPQEMGEPIKRFCNLSDSISYSFIDTVKNPDIVNEYNQNHDQTVQDYSIVVECGDRVRVFGATDYATYDESTGTVNISLLEKLAAGVLLVTKEDIPKVYFLNGNGETGYEALKELVVNNGAEAYEVDLAADKVEFDENSKLIVICNPTYDYSDAVIRKLGDFAVNSNEFGRNIMVFSSAGAYDLPNLEKYLSSTWGIAFNDDYVLDMENAFNDYPNCIIPYATTEKILLADEGFSVGRELAFPVTRSLKLLHEETGEYQTQFAAKTFNTAYSIPDGTVIEDWITTNIDKTSESIVAALSVKYSYIANVERASYCFVSGSTSMLTSDFLTNTGNGEFIMQMYQTMVNERDDVILSARKSSTSTAAVFTAKDAKTMTIVILAVIPGIFLILGIVVYIRRRFM